MTAEEMWKLSGLTGEYEAWAYGVAANKLADLTNRGIKTATASAYILYEIDGEELPKAGSYSVICDEDDNAVCIIKTTKVYVVPFNQVGEEHAYKEGEGDRSLKHWRKVHKAFFAPQMKDAGLSFKEDMLVVCEEFEKVFSY